jgi:hypothetical protein
MRPVVESISAHVARQLVTSGLEPGTMTIGPDDLDCSAGVHRNEAAPAPAQAAP